MPLTLEGFDFATPKIVDQLTGSLASLKEYNALSVPSEYFAEAMSRLRERYLNLPLDAVLHPASSSALQAVKMEQAAASAAPAVTEKELTAQQLFERGFNASELEEKIRYLTEAVRLTPSPNPAAGTTLGGSYNYQQDLEGVVRARTELLHQALEDLEHSYDVTLEALGDALDLKDYESPGHSKRVTAYTIALARAMGISPAVIKVIARGAFLHDIGKMGIPDEILRKPAALSPKEQKVMREHCTKGFDILRKIPFLSEAAEIVFTHQERYDGSGYPTGLRGGEIPIGARIFAVSDTLDAITSDRPYRKASSFDAAREEVLRCSGTQFDPSVVEAFLKIPNELWNELRSEISGQNKRFSTFELAQPARLRGLKP